MKNLNNTKIRLGKLVPSLDATSDAPVKLIFVILYIVGAVLVWNTQTDIAAVTENIQFISPLAVFAARNLLSVYLIFAGIALAILILMPLGKRFVEEQMRSIGLVNHADEVPVLKKKFRDPQNPRIAVWEFTSQGIPLKVWKDKQPAIETALDITIFKIKNESGKSRVRLYAVPAVSDLPEMIQWQDKYLSQQSFVLSLGESFTGPVTVDLAKIPHILLGGATGSGKSVLLKLLLMQAKKKGAEVCIADFKGGVDFPTVWHQNCRMCFEEQATLELLTELTEELEHRKQLLTATGQPNIDRYNEATGENLTRYIFACDEVAEMLDKTGLTKEQKEIIGKIESRLSMIARQGRAFGIHLIKEVGFKPNSMEIIHTILHPVFAVAVRDGLIRTNPTEGVMTEIKKSHDWEKGKRHALTVAQQTAFISYIAGSRQFAHWLPIFTVLLRTRCRVGEAVGLRWQDCDFEENVISVNHNLIYRVQDSGKCEYHVTTPKTRSGIRIIPMLSEVKKALQGEYDRQLREGFTELEVDGYSGFIFQNQLGECLNPHAINRAIDRISKAYNREETERAAKENREPELLPHFSAHNLRHTFCTRFCENETNLKIIQEIMGHADISTTMNVYNEATREKKMESFANLEGKIRIS